MAATLRAVAGAGQRAAHPPIASGARRHARNNVAQNCNNHQIALAGYVAGIGDLPMRMFETVTSSALVIAAQALVVGVIISAL